MRTLLLGLAFAVGCSTTRSICESDKVICLETDAEAPTADAAGPIDASIPTLDASPEPDAGQLEDARVSVDAGPMLDSAVIATDAGHDTGVSDAGSDAGALIDAATDAGASWRCSVVPQSGCPMGYACRLSNVGRMPGNGPPECVRAGTRTEASPSCSVGGEESDDCRAGLFCWTQCRRYCDPNAATPCPNDWEYCKTDGLLDPNPLGLGYCEVSAR